MQARMFDEPEPPCVGKARDTNALAVACLMSTIGSSVSATGFAGVTRLRGQTRPDAYDSGWQHIGRGSHHGLAEPSRRSPEQRGLDGRRVNLGDPTLDALDFVARRAAAAGIVVDQLLHHTDKAIVARGHRARQPVVVKLLTTSDLYWVQRRRHEVEVYQRFAARPPALPVPRLLYEDGAMMVLTVVLGARVHDARHLTDDPGPVRVGSILAALDAVQAWEPDPPLPPLIADYSGRVDAEHAAGLIENWERDTLHVLLDRCGPDRVVQHGDPLPANILLDRDLCALVDWEHTGTYLPGWDLALLDIVAGPASPTIRDAIDASVRRQGITDAYLINLVLVLAREIRIHRSLPTSDPLRAARLTTLAGEHSTVRLRLHQHHQDTNR